jgi:DNA-directed RNA polymerase subunit N (RpoN/RPB10)
MGFLDKLTSLFAGKGGGGVESDGRGMYFYVRCAACGEKIRVRVDTFNDLAQEFDDKDKVSGYTLDKDVMGTRCFRMMHLHIQFDSGKRILDKSVQNGTLVSKEEYLQP